MNDDLEPVGYDPGISENTWEQLLNNRDIFKKDSIRLLFQIESMGGKATCTQLSKKFGGNPNQYNNIAINTAKRIQDYTKCDLYERKSNKAYWPIMFLGKKVNKHNTDGVFEWSLRPELRTAFRKYSMHSNETKINMDFFDFLTEKRLVYPIDTVENFLLSLKSKQFIILSGGTGTGKTKLAQTYGEFIRREFSQRTVQTEVKLGESSKNHGFTVRREDFLNTVPEAGKLDGKYRFRLGNFEGTGQIQMSPRFWFRGTENLEKAIQTIEELKKISDKAPLTILLPSYNGVDSYLIVPVGSNWTDSRHIIGYLNAITGKYTRTPALDLMIEANRNPWNPYMLILDEMNLSHVERYFSDIISCMESGEPLILSSDDPNEVPRELNLGDNLFIIGTVNMDETTYAFSPKVLDRANVIEFEPASINDIRAMSSYSLDPSKDVEFLQDCMKGTECRNMSFKEIMDLLAGSNTKMVEDFVSDLDEIQKIMQRMKLPFGFRTIEEVSRFMYVAWIYESKSDFQNWKRYMDAQIVQKILPKIHGNSSISVPLKELHAYCRDHGYTRSESKLSRMIEVLDSQRHVSFNC